MVEPTPEIVASRVQIKDKTLITGTGAFRDRKGSGVTGVFIWGEGSGSDCPLAETNCCEPRSVQGSKRSSADSVVPSTQCSVLRPGSHKSYRRPKHVWI